MGTENLKSEVLLELIFCLDTKNSEDEIIKALLHKCLRKLSCFMAGVVKSENGQLTHKQLIPFKFVRESSWSTIKNHIELNKDNNNKDYFEMIIENNYYYIYCLGMYGYLILGRKNQFDPIFKKDFRLVVNLLGKIISQSIENELRQEAELKLKQERQLLRTIIDNIPISIYTKDLNYRKTLANISELKHLGGLTEADVIGKTDFELYGESIGTNTRIEDDKILLNGESIIAEEKNIFSDRWALISKIPIKNEKGSITGMVGISYDFTERKKAQEQLSIFLKIFDNLSDAVQISLESGQLFYINKAASERFSVPQDKIQDYNVADLEDVFKSKEIWNKHVSEVKKNDFITIEGIHKNQITGVKMPVEETVKCIVVEGRSYIASISRDISERLNAEKVLKQSEEKFRIMTENSGDVIWHLDKNYVCDYISPADEIMRGFKKEEVIGRPLWNLLKPEGIKQVKEINEKRVSENKIGIINRTVHLEIEQLCKDGSWIWTEVNSTPHFNVDGEIIGYQGVTRNISERKKADEILKWNQSLLSLMSSSSPLGFLVIDNRTDDILYFNEQFCQIWGVEFLAERMRNKELKNNDIIPHILPMIVDVDAFDETCKPLQFESNRMVLEDEIEFVNKCTIRRFTTQIRGENDQYYGRFYIFEDITERKKYEIELQNNEKKFRQLTENMLDIVWTTDMNFNLTFLSPSAEKIFGESIEKQMMRPMTDKFTPASMNLLLSSFAIEMEKENDLTSDRNRTLKLEVEHYRADKSIFWAEINMSILRNESGNAIGIQGLTRDISMRKQIESNLRQSEERKASLIASMSDIVYVLDNNLVLKEYHLPARHDVLLDPKPYLEKSFDDIPLPKLAKQHIKNALKYCIETRNFSKIEYYLDLPSGRFWFELNATVLYDQNADQIGITCIIRDVTNRKEREDVIRKQVKLQDILIKISSIYINVDLNDVENIIQESLKELGGFVEADRAYIFDYDFINNTTSNTYEWCSEGVSAEIDNLQKIPLDFIQFWVEKHKKGLEFYIENVSELPDDGPESLKGILEPQGIKSILTLPMLNGTKLLGFVGFDFVKRIHSYNEKEKKLLEVFSQMLVNVNERKRSYSLLKMQEEKYRNIISNMNLGIIEFDKEDRILYSNQSFSEISGYSTDELLLMKSSVFLREPEDSKIIENKLNKRKNGISDSYKLPVLNKKGDPRWWLVSGAPNYNDNNELIGSIGITLDITEQKKLESELEQAIIEAQSASKAKEVFLANMSHEIRTPLNVITGMVRELGKEPLNERQQTYVKHSETAAYHLLTIINNILDISKIEAGEFELNKKDFSISSITSDVKSMLFSKAVEKNLEFRIFESPDLKRSLIGDAGRLRQILINLIGNALKFTDTGYVEIKVLSQKTDEHFQMIHFEVNDSGIGMGEEYMNKLFDKFSQEHGESNRKFEGTGLGMSIAKELIQLMGGSINAKSEQGVGTSISFEINFPIGNEAKLVENNTMRVNKNCFENVKVLLVEDNEMNRFIAKQSFNFVGCKVTEAENGLEAIEQIKNNHFDLVFMDIQMPEMDGVQATKEIRNTLKNTVPIVALTANAFKHDIDLYLSVGMNDFLIKPYKEDDLFQKIAMYSKANSNISRNDSPVSIKEKLFDLTQLEELSRGDRLFVNKMIDIFKNLAIQTIGQLNDSLIQKDLISINKVAHKIKPSIDNMGITLLKEKIRELEKFNLDDHSEAELIILTEEVCKVLAYIVEDIKYE